MPIERCGGSARNVLHTEARLSSEEVKYRGEDLRRELEVSGYTVVREFLSAGLLSSLKALKVLTEHAIYNVQPHFGAVIGAEQHSNFGSVILLEQQYALLEAMGFPDSRFFTGYLISKPPGAPRLHWHQDWWGWSHEISYQQAAPVVYLMYYLTDTNRENGCLRVLPGSHVRRNKLHALLETRPTHPTTQLAKDDVSLSTRSEEKDISVSAGDLILRDARLLHASHANLSHRDRDLLILSFVPRWTQLPERLQCAFERKRPKIEYSWPAGQADPVLQRATVYKGAAAPILLQRTPNFT